MIIGWIGTGIMGAPMAAHVLNSGYKLCVYNRTKEKAVALINQGATWCGSPKEVAEKADVVFSIIGFPKDVEDVYLGEHGLVNGCSDGMILVDMTTTSPSLMLDINKQATKKGCTLIDAPVSGGEVGAINGALSIMLGGTEAAIKKVMPILECFGKNIQHQGDVGAGQHAKMCNQIVIASTMIGVCESLVYGLKAGLDLTTMISSIQKGAAGCWTLDVLAPKMIAQDYAPGFIVEHFIKDLGIALQEAKQMNITLPGLELAHKMYKQLSASGNGSSGTQALIKTIQEIAENAKV